MNVPDYIVFERFKEGFIKGDDNECWEWLLSNNGKKCEYGVIKVEYQKFYTHRVSYCYHNNMTLEQLYKSIKHVLHTCDNKRCVNPNHLYLGTQFDNNRDNIIRHRYVNGENTSNHVLTDKDVEEIRHRYKTENITQERLAKEYGVKQPCISRIIYHVRRRLSTLPRS